MVTWDDFRVERIDTGEARLAVRVGGEGPPLVLLHGFPQHSRMWRQVAPLLSDRFTVIAPDQRGMGASSIPETLFTKTDLARDRAFVADYDLGADVAVSFARDFPERVLKLAVLEFVLASSGLEEVMVPQPGWNADSNWHFSVFCTLRYNLNSTRVTPESLSLS